MAGSSTGVYAKINVSGLTHCDSSVGKSATISPFSSQYRVSSLPRSQSARAWPLKLSNKADAAKVTDGKIPGNTFLCSFIVILHREWSAHEGSILCIEHLERTHPISLLLIDVQLNIDSSSILPLGKASMPTISQYREGRPARVYSIECSGARGIASWNSLAPADHKSASIESAELAVSYTHLRA